MQIMRRHAVRANIARLAVPLAAAWLLGAIAPAPGQTIEDRGFRPVDQFVDDMDPLSRSLRYIDPGLDATGQFSNVYRRILPDGTESQKLYLITPGITGEFDQSIYRRNSKGRVRQLVPSGIQFNTVNLLGNTSKQPAANEPALEPTSLNGQVDGQVIGAPIGSPISGDVAARPRRAASVNPPTNDAPKPLSYDRLRDRHREWLFNEITLSAKPRPTRAVGRSDRSAPDDAPAQLPVRPTE